MFSVNSRVLGLSVVIGVLGFTLFGWLYPSAPKSEVATVISSCSIALAYVIDYLWKILQRNSKNLTSIPMLRMIFFSLICISLPSACGVSNITKDGMDHDKGFLSASFAMTKLDQEAKGDLACIPM